ncbi:hypothetical protein [uncultured Tateyamaria sp.]|uniref:hypothetical protein n=1 Tax=uncultured Tateyamaria sp. TaxID=455651 RepID=UPI002620A779|nr:hypothetical protein [uncultured Tateyamaria sp.]
MDRNIYYYIFQTRHGPIKIIPEPGGRYAVIYDEEHLGSYHSPIAAADDVSGGYTFSPSNGVEFDELDVPSDIGNWEQKLFAHVGRLRPA